MPHSPLQSLPWVACPDVLDNGHSCSQEQANTNQNWDTGMSQTHLHLDLFHKCTEKRQEIQEENNCDADPTLSRHACLQGHRVQDGPDRWATRAPIIICLSRKRAITNHCYDRAANRSDFVVERLTLQTSRSIFRAFITEHIISAEVRNWSQK